MSAALIGRHRPSIPRGSALQVNAGGLLTPRSSALPPPSQARWAQWRRGVRAPWSQWRGPCRTCTDFPVLHRRRECSRRSRSRAAGRRGRRRRPLGRCRCSCNGAASPPWREASSPTETRGCVDDACRRRPHFSFDPAALRSRSGVQEAASATDRKGRLEPDAVKVACPVLRGAQR